MTTSSVRDPYTVLGIGRPSSADDIKKAYRELAKKLHPDRNPNDKKAEAKLKEINAAYNFLSDADKRRRYDAGEIDANGQEKVFSYQRHSRPHARQRGHGARNFFDADDFTTEDILNDIFGMGKKKTASSSSAPEPNSSRDVNYTLKVPFEEAMLGGKRTIKLADGKEVSLAIPPGSEDATKLRLKGQGQPGRFGGAAGDAYILLSVDPHAFFIREGYDIKCELPVSLTEAVLGGAIRVPALGGLVEMKVPKHANTGTVLRLKGKGVPKTDGTAGDQYVKLKIVLPDEMDDSLGEFLKKWKPGQHFNPRKKAGLE